MKFRLVLTLLVALQLAGFAHAMRLVTINGHTMVHLRSFAQQVGAVIDRDPTTNTYSVALNGHTVYMVPYSMTAWVDDNQVDLKVPAVIADNHMNVPFRFICNALGVTSTWAPGYESVVIDYGGQQWTVARNDAWAARPHVWQHPFTYRVTLNFRSAPRQFFTGRPGRVPTAVGRNHGTGGANHPSGSGGYHGTAGGGSHTTTGGGSHTTTGGGNHTTTGGGNHTTTGGGNHPTGGAGNHPAGGGGNHPSGGGKTNGGSGHSDNKDKNHNK